MELIKSFSFIKKVKLVSDKTQEQEILNGLQQAVEEVKLFNAGKLIPKPLKELLDEQYFTVTNFAHVIIQ